MQHILGIWDGHDAGAALISAENILAVINEERLSRRKLEVGFPARSIQACLDQVGVAPEQVQDIALSTSDPAKTLTRLFPQLKEEYYLLRRRKKAPGRLDPLKKIFKYRLTELAPNSLSRGLSRAVVSKGLKTLGLTHHRLHLVDHHQCHAEAAARLSGFQQALVLTLDGVGDGLAGSIWQYDTGRLALLQRLPAKHSLGIFFEHVTNLMHMRELEDEGKVMALADFAYPVAAGENPMLDLFSIRELSLYSHLGSRRLYRELKTIRHCFPLEQFAFMAQQTLEVKVLDLVQQAMNRTGLSRLAVAGGVFSNVKVNMKLEELEQTERLFVFPHMGDGGLALGAGLAISRFQSEADKNPLEHLYLGPDYPEQDILSALQSSGWTWKRVSDPSALAAELIFQGCIVLWFRGRMEMGPRALGHRSILARPDDLRMKDRLNLVLKKRVWYQPFCPSILEEDASDLLDTRGRVCRDNPFMTTAYRVREQHRELLQAVMNVDATCRPHFVGPEEPAYRDLLLQLKQRFGHGVVLNTSFNIHGEPLVCTPAEALDMFARSEARVLFLEEYFIEKPCNPCTVPG